jgi:regulator of PEP synthase PpsR (kinase-PPPase family)
VILGVSRSSKTPLCYYIAYRGYRVANVPIVRELALPKELADVDPRRVFGLVIEPNVLVNIRRARMATFGMSEDSAYGDLAEIRAEIAHARRIYAEHPDWTVIDMTQKAIEETAALILAKYRERFEPEKAGTPEPLPSALRRAAAKRTKKPTKGKK